MVGKRLRRGEAEVSRVGGIEASNEKVRPTYHVAGPKKAKKQEQKTIPLEHTIPELISTAFGVEVDFGGGCDRQRD